MRASISWLVAGMLLCQLLPALPPVLLTLSAVLLLVIARRHLPRAALLLALGFAWAVLRAGLDLAARLPSAREGEALIAVGRPAAPVQPVSRGVRLLLEIDELRRGEATIRGPRRIAITWYEAPREHPAIGALCRLAVRLRRPHGTANPGGVDTERWQFMRGIDAVGYVVPHAANGCRAEPRGHWIARVRAELAAAIRRAAPGPAGEVIVALAVGEERGIGEAEWRVFRDTGTAHLVSVSGLHIAFIAGFAFAAARWAWSRSVRLLHVTPAAPVALGIAIAAAFAYTLLAGAAVPAVRSLVMVSAGLFYAQLGQRVLGTDALLAALAVILLCDPAQSLSVSLWLSFGAVGLLVLMSTTRPPAGRLRREVAQHLGFTLWLAPLLGLVFQALALASPLANLVAVPWTTFVVTPLALLGVALAPIEASAASAVWRLAAWCWDFVWHYLAWLDRHAPVLILPGEPAPATALLAALALLVWWVPLLPARRWLAPVLLCTLFAGTAPPPALGEADLTLLDVGQGLSVVLRTARHTLVYDAGPSYPGGDAGERIVLPFLRARGVRRIDTLVLSHPDSDHIGGARALIAGLAVARVLVSPRQPDASDAERCRAGMRWHWDGVDFAVLHPAGRAASDNEGSCVLRVTTAGGSVLLPGDGEADTEAALRALPSLRAAVIVVPHHGSATSSHPDFVAAVHPRYALVAAGYRNRFGFPAPSVVARYRAVGARVLETSVLGAIDLRLGASPERPRAHRLEHRHYWQDPPHDGAAIGLSEPARVW